MYILNHKRGLAMDKETFTRAVEHYQNSIYRLALHALGRPADAEDVVQEVFLRLFRTDKPFDSEEHLRRWLLRVGSNLCRDILKSPWRRRQAQLTDTIPAPAFEREDQRELYRAVMALEEKYRTVLYLFYYEDLPVREIAALLSLGESAVTTRLSRGRAKLKAALKEGWQDE